MSGTHDSSIPKEVRSSIRRELGEQARNVERLWTLLDAAEDNRPVEPSTDAAWTDLISALGSEPAADGTVHRASDRSARRRRRRTVAAGVVFAVVVLLGITWAYRPVTVSTDSGGQQTVSLPDGSTVDLNSATSLRYARAFRTLPFVSPDRRLVRLTGEAYFEVVPGDDPFVVETDHAHIEVLGTGFNVRARRGAAEDGTVVTLSEGRLRLAVRRTPDRALTLDSPGASARITSAAVHDVPSEDTVSLDHVLAWRRKGFAVVNRPLEAILDEVERRFAVAIAPREGLDLSDSMSLFYPRGAAPERILLDVCLAHDCTYRQTSRGFALSPRHPSDEPPAPSAVDSTRTAEEIPAPSAAGSTGTSAGETTGPSEAAPPGASAADTPRPSAPEGARE